MIDDQKVVAMTVERIAVTTLRRGARRRMGAHLLVEHAIPQGLGGIDFRRRLRQPHLKAFARCDVLLKGSMRPVKYLRKSCHSYFPFDCASDRYCTGLLSRYYSDVSHLRGRAQGSRSSVDRA